MPRLSVLGVFACRQWESPEVVIRQTLIRQLVLKLGNLLVLYMAQSLGTIRTTLPAADPTRCPEAEAAQTFLSLILLDCVIAGPVMFVVKWIVYYGGRGVGYVIGMRPPERGVFDLPTEIVNICYRQCILIVGSVVSPWLFAIGLFTNSILYFFKYVTVVYLLRPPDKPFKASQVKKVFFAVLFVSNLIAIFPVAHFLTSRVNPNCGPLRTYDCALEVEFNQPTLYEINSQNQTACMYQLIHERANYAVFTEVLLPVSLEDLDPISALMEAAGGNSTTLDRLGSSCGFSCWLSLVLSAVFSSVTMVIAAILLCICLCFARAQARRLNRQLAEAVEEAANEHSDKVKLLRYAGVSLD